MDMVALTRKQRVLSECLVVIAKAARINGIVLARHEARRMIRNNPDCGLTEAEVAEMIFQMAVDERLSVDLT